MIEKQSPAEDVASGSERMTDVATLD